MTGSSAGRRLPSAFSLVRVCPSMESVPKRRANAACSSGERCWPGKIRTARAWKASLIHPPLRVGQRREPDAGDGRAPTCGRRVQCAGFAAWSEALVVEGATIPDGGRAPGELR